MMPDEKRDGRTDIRVTQINCNIIGIRNLKEAVPIRILDDDLARLKHDALWTPKRESVSGFPVI